MKHTPGPWDWFTKFRDDEKVKESGLHCRFLYGSDGQGFAHTVGLSADGVDQANANLIAAAPDLLEVCRAVDTHYSGSLDHQPHYVRAARALLAKVDGTAPETPIEATKE